LANILGSYDPVKSVPLGSLHAKLCETSPEISISECGTSQVSTHVPGRERKLVEVDFGT